MNLRGPLRGGASDADLVGLLQNIWRQRADRYSELRKKDTKKSRDSRVEMYRIGG
jgi:cyclic pyranopterin phosphate synthase